MQKFLLGVLGSALMACLMPVASQPKSDLPAYHLQAVKFFEQQSVQDEISLSPGIKLVSILQDKRPASKGPTFPSLAQELEARPLEKVVTPVKAETPPSPAAEISTEPLGSAPPKAATTEDRLDKIERSLLILVTALTRSNQLTPDEASRIAKSKLEQAGKVEVSESGTVTVDKVQTVTPAANPVAAPVYSYSADPCQCEPMASYSGGSNGSYQRGSYQAGGGSTGNYGASYSGGSTGSFSGGSNGSKLAGSFSGGSNGSNQAASYGTNYASNYRSVGRTGVIAQAVNNRRAAASVPAVSTTYSSPAYSSAVDCKWFQAVDGNWYQVCNK